MKTCRKCRTSKPASAFYRNRENGDGCASYCKVCQRAYQHQRTPNYCDQALHAIVDRLGYRPADPDLLHTFQA